MSQRTDQFDCAVVRFVNPQLAPWSLGGGSGTGDVVGPASATDNALARFDSTTGKLIQNSAVTVSDGGNFSGVGTLNTHTIPGGTGTIALVSQITGTNSGTNTGDQTIALTGDVTGSGTGTFAATIANNAVTLGKMATVATDSILGRATASTGNVEVLTALPFASTGDVTRPADSNAQTIANDVVTYAKMQNISAASKLLGRGSSGGSGDPEEITLGTNLSMSGTTLNASGGGGSGDVVGPGSSTDSAFSRFDGTTGKLLKDSSTTCDESGNIVTPGDITCNEITTADPGSGAHPWRLGQVQSSFGLIILSTSYVEVMINGVLVKLAIAVGD